MSIITNILQFNSSKRLVPQKSLSVDFSKKDCISFRGVPKDIYQQQESDIGKTKESAFEFMVNNLKKGFIKNICYLTSLIISRKIFTTGLTKFERIKSFFKALAVAILPSYSGVFAGKVLLQPSKKMKEHEPFIKDLFDSGKMKEITINSTDDVKLNAWYKPPENNQDTILFCHGRRCNISKNQNILTKLLKSNPERGLLALDYRQYGKSTGVATLGKISEDVQSTMDFLNENGIPNNKVIVMGRSLGSYFTSDLVGKKDNYKALVLSTMYTKMTDLLDFGFSKIGLGMKNIFGYEELSVPENLKSVKKTPVLILNSKNDSIVSPISIQKLHDTLKKEGVDNVKVCLGDFGGHTDFYDKEMEVLENFITGLK